MSVAHTPHPSLKRAANNTTVRNEVGALKAGEGATGLQLVGSGAVHPIQPNPLPTPSLKGCMSLGTPPMHRHPHSTTPAASHMSTRRTKETLGCVRGLHVGRYLSGSSTRYST